MSLEKKNLGVTLEMELYKKLEQEAQRQRRTKSQTVETLIDRLDVDNMELIKSQADRIKELEKELVLTSADTTPIIKTIEPEELYSLTKENDHYQEENERLTIALQDQKALTDKLQAKLINLSTAIDQLHEASKEEL